MKVGIVGSGVAGLAAAIRLKNLGYEVSVFEANDFPGGKLSEFNLGAFRFDAGPSLFTMPHFIEELFELSNKDIKAYFEYFKLDSVCEYFWEDGTHLKAHSDTKKFSQAVEEQIGVSSSIMEAALKESQRKYEITSKVFLHQSLHQIKNYLNKATAKGVLNLFNLGIFKTMDEVNRSYGNPKLRQLFNRFATYNGSNPYEAPAVLNAIPHLEHGIGAFFPTKGMYSITLALYNLAKDIGVNFHFNEKVKEIIVNNQAVEGLETIHRTYTFDKVISNVDINFTYRQLMPNQKAPERTLKQPKSSSALIFYWGIQGEFPQLDLHNILFSNHYKEEFRHLFDLKTIYEDPTIYINITKKYQPQDAPEGCENWFTMINVPHDSGQNWEALIPKARAAILKKASKMLNRDIEKLIVEETYLDPKKIEQRTSAHLGALYGTSSNNRMAAFLRHPNFSRSIKNLYFCGGSVHPGGGIPLSLLSAKIVADLIEPSLKYN